VREKIVMNFSGLPAQDVEPGRAEFVDAGLPPEELQAATETTTAAAKPAAVHATRREAFRVGCLEPIAEFAFIAFPLRCSQPAKRHSMTSRYTR
jgi:hypothetical protein